MNKLKKSLFLSPKIYSSVIECTRSYFSGFIDFIVDPSFLCMSEMLEKIIMHLLKEQRNSSHSLAEDQTSDVVKKEKKTSTATLHSTSSSSRPKSPFGSGNNCIRMKTESVA
jgi:hypothetical protein